MLESKVEKKGICHFIVKQDLLHSLLCALYAVVILFFFPREEMEAGGFSYVCYA